MNRDPRIDAYIDTKIADFAKPILRHLRDVIHEACPEGEETLKWSHPSFVYKGKILAGFAAFKAHATFGFWSGSQVMESNAEATAMGQFGRITTLKDLPSDRDFVRFVKQSRELAPTARPNKASAKPKAKRAAAQARRR